MRTKGVETLASAESLPNLVRWALLGRGPLTSNLGEAVAFVRSRPDLKAPDLELLLAPVLFEEEGLKPPSEHGLTLAVVLLEPRSSGTVLLRSADPRVLPAIDPRYLTDPGGEDAATLLRGLRLARRVLAQEPLASLVDAEILPGADARSDDALLAHIRALSQTLYHPAGTCRMGSDVGSVVDPQLRVRGIAGLRIADASVIPKLPRGHTNWPTVMIAERASELVGGCCLARRLVDEPCAHEPSVLDVEHPGARDRRRSRPVERHTRARDEVDDLEHDIAVRAARDRARLRKAEQELDGGLTAGTLRQLVGRLDRELELPARAARGSADSARTGSTRAAPRAPLRVAPRSPALRVGRASSAVVGDRALPT